MKKVVCFILSLFLLAGVFAGDFDLENVPAEYIGTYIPVQMEECLKEYMVYERSLNEAHKTNYDILLLKENICYSQERFSDGYAVTAANFAKWKFETTGNEKYIIDENKMRYRRITEDNNKGYEMYATVVLSILFSDAIHNKNISIKGDRITIYGEEYKFNLWPYYIADDEIIYMSGRILKRDGLSANFYGIESVGKWDIQRTEEIQQTIPLFYWDDKNYPNLDPSIYKSSKKDLRILRNLVYAKHGYKFKSEDLRNIFSDFDWYTINPNFSESEFSEQEKQLIKTIQKYEAELK